MTSDKFIAVTVEHPVEESNPPAMVDVDMLVNLRYVQYFSFPIGMPTQMKMVNYGEMPIKNPEADIVQKINYPILKKPE